MILRASLLLALLAIPTSADEAPPKWEKEIAGIEAKAAAKPIANGGIVFTGSSSIRMWSTLAEDFPKHRVVNHGFGGSMISDSIHFADRLVFPFEPRLIVMYAGGNDINNGKTPDTVAADFRAFVEKVHAKLPEVEIAYISIAPNPKRWSQIEKVRQANGLIAEYCSTNPKLKYIDAFSQMLGSDGLPKPEIFLKDNLHMNAAGYRLWTSVVGPFLGAPDAGKE